MSFVASSVDSNKVYSPLYGPITDKITFFISDEFAVNNLYIRQKAVTNFLFTLLSVWNKVCVSFTMEIVFQFEMLPRA